MKVLIVGDAFGFPNGTGATARVHAYARGLMENGVEVKVFCLEPTEPRQGPRANTQAKGNYEGIDFEYTYGSTARPSNFFLRRWRQLIGPWRFFRAVRSETTKGNGIDAIILFSNSLFWIVWVVAVARIAGVQCIQEKSEFPFVSYKKTPWIRLYAWLYTRTVYKLFDGIIVISTFLEEYFSRCIRRGARILRVPILVDVNRFEAMSSPTSHERKRIVYSGSLDHPGEVKLLIEAFSALATGNPAWDLQIIGGTSNPEVPVELERTVLNLGLADRVDFTGMIERRELPRYLGDADVLVLPRQAGLFSKAGFPTKLGEYLATGKPVVVTSTGDIPLYLEDGVSAYLVAPGDVQSFVKKLHYVMSHPENAAEVGRRGREVARRSFDCKVHCRRIVEFIHELAREHHQDKRRCVR